MFLFWWWQGYGNGKMKDVLGGKGAD